MALQTDRAYIDVNVRYRVSGLDQSAKKAKNAGDQFTKFGKILSQVGQSLIAFKIVDTLIRSTQQLAVFGKEANIVFEKASVQLRVFTADAYEAADIIDFLAFQRVEHKFQVFCRFIHVCYEKCQVNGILGGQAHSRQGRGNQQALPQFPQDPQVIFPDLPLGNQQ